MQATWERQTKTKQEYIYFSVRIQLHLKKENKIQGNNRNTSSYFTRQILSCPYTTGGLTRIIECPVTISDVPSQPRQPAVSYKTVLTDTVGICRMQ